MSFYPLHSEVFGLYRTLFLSHLIVIVLLSTPFLITVKSIFWYIARLMTNCIYKMSLKINYFGLFWIKVKKPCKSCQQMQINPWWNLWQSIISDLCFYFVMLLDTKGSTLECLRKCCGQFHIANVSYSSSQQGRHGRNDAKKKYKKNSNGSCHPEHISIKEAMYEWYSLLLSNNFILLLALGCEDKEKLCKTTELVSKWTGYLLD